MKSCKHLELQLLIALGLSSVIYSTNDFLTGIDL